VAKHVGHDDEVGAAADEGGGEGVPADVCGNGLDIKAALSGEAADDAASTADRQSVAAAVEQQRRRVVGARPSGAFVEPKLQHHKPSAAGNPYA
jgi:hypothetical protein